MSSINTTLPVQGVPYSASPIRDNFSAAASDIDALQTLNAGGAPPSNPVLGQLWLDTSAGTTYVLNVFNDRQSQWVPIAALDSLNSLWVPPVGGGEPVSLLADDTTDLGSFPQTVETITGGGPIFSFGASAPAGVIKVLQFDGATTLIYDATLLILPGAADITTTAGDVAIAYALGSGNWQVLFFLSTAAIVAQGGTGRTTLTIHSVLLGNGTEPVNFAVPDTTGYALLSTGALTDPAFGQVNLTIGVTDILPVANGGTGIDAITAHNLIIGKGTLPAVLLAPGTIGYPLVSKGPVTDPAYAVLGPAGGGTGLTAITAHNLIVGNGTLTSTLLPPSATSGVPLISKGAAADPDYGVAVVAGGGTGLATITAHAVMIGEGASNVAVAAPGAAGLALVSTGAGSDPAFGQINAATGLTGVLPVANGGTGDSTLTAHGVLIGAGASAVVLAAPGTSGLPLLSTGAGSDPAFGSLTLGAIAAIADKTALGNVSGGAAAPVALTTTQLTTLINPFTSTLSGAAPASGGGTTNFLRADGSWVNPNAGVGAAVQHYAPYPGNASIIIPAASITVILMGGGGGGGDGSADAVGPAGGGGGGYGGCVIYPLTGLTPGNTLTLVVGAAGAAGAAGGDTVLSSGSETITTATAGGGGGGASAITGPNAGGSGGTATGGTAAAILLPGYAGGPGLCVPSSFGIPGQGGRAGGGGYGKYGAGGDGGYSDTGSFVAGTGGEAGFAVVTWLQ